MAHSRENTAIWCRIFLLRCWIPTFRSLSFLRLHSSHSLTMRPHRIQVSSSRCDRLEEAEELDTSEEPLLRREPLIERIDLESASSNLQEEKTGNSNYDWLLVMEKANDYKAQHACLIQHGAHAKMSTRSHGREIWHWGRLWHCTDQWVYGNIAEAPEAAGLFTLNYRIRSWVIHEDLRHTAGWLWKIHGEEKQQYAFVYRARLIG